MMNFVDAPSLVRSGNPVKKPLRDLAALFPGVSLSRPQADDGAAETARVISIRDLEAGRVAPLGELQALDLRPGPLTERCRTRRDDVLVSCRGTQLKVALVGPETAGAVASSNLIVVRPGPDLLPGVALAFLRNPATQADMLRSTRSSAGVIALSATDLGRLLVPVPPLDEQRRIVQLIEAVEATYRAGLRCAELRRRLGHELAGKMLFGKP